MLEQYMARDRLTRQVYQSECLGEMELRETQGSSGGEYHTDMDTHNWP